jgi:sugar diacid utilization regulator
MRVLDLLGRGELELSVVWAEPAMLERDIRGSASVEPAGHGGGIAPGSLVLVDGAWPADAESTDDSVSELSAYGVAALAVGATVAGHISAHMVDACREHGIVLLAVGPGTSFDEVARAVTSADSADSAIATRGVVFTRNLLDGIGSGIGAPGALRAFHDQYATRCWVLESGGSVSAVAGAEPTADEVEAVWNRMLGAPDGESVVFDADGRSASVWPIVTDNVRTIGYLVCGGDHRAWPADLQRVVRTLLLVARVELELQNSRRDTEQAPVMDLVQHLIADNLSPGDASARLRMLGLDPQRPITAVAAQVDDSDYPSRAVLDTLVALLSADGRVVVGCDLGDEAVALLGGSDTTPELVGLAQRPGHPLLDLLGARRLRVGVSERATGLGQLAAAVASARARMRAAVGDGTVVLSTRSTPQSYTELLDLLPERITAAFGRSLLSPLVDYDVRHGSDLVLTLRVFLETSGGWQQASTALHVHVNTLRYRIRRIEELTQRDLSRMRERVDLFLALETAPPTPPPGG